MDEILQVLGYSDSTNFIRSGSADFLSVPDHAHTLRKATEKCGLVGVYALRPDPSSSKGIIPTVFVCRADDEDVARAIHKRVWNQNLVPFLLVLTPRSARLYAGFKFAEDQPDVGMIEMASAIDEVATKLAPIHADAIDSGRIWDGLGKFITPESRVDWQLLEHLRVLDNSLRREGLDRATSHALIGKFVYLRYLRDRDILSDRKLERWGIDPTAVFSRDASLTSFWSVDAQLDEWLNGAVFPLAANKRDIKADHLKRVAGVFFGDTPRGQLHLNFHAYDFSFIPTELLSSIYEQFLHSPDPKSGVSLGKSAGAYYTPIPLVNFVLGELDEKKPLREGMKTLDPACGSGAFLVQCYRRLIEVRRASSGKLRPSDLRQILVDHIFGVEKDGDACQITELSLILTLLDFVTPPDLESQPRFRLPCLRNQNVFEADFFDTTSTFAQACAGLKFDWIVGNPPWKELGQDAEASGDRDVWQWMRANAANHPVGGNQVAEAFVWKSMAQVAEDGVCGLVLPAMTLFKSESKTFRKTLFANSSVWCVANFANLAYVLFAGRAARSAAVFFLSPRNPDPHARILTYAPFIINQEANRPTAVGRQQATWSIVVNADELQELPTRDVADGKHLPWKVAMWGSRRDQKLLERVEHPFPSLGEFCRGNGLTMHEGFQLRDGPCAGVQSVPELAGQTRVDFNELRFCGRIFSLPSRSLGTIERDRSYLRIRGGMKGLEVSRPPHVLVDASRRFAVYLPDFLAIPPRQIGIAGKSGSERLLKALSLYLSSDFAVYHQFFMSPEWGINANRATLRGLKALPTPLGSLNDKVLREWEQLHGQLVAESDSHENAILTSCDGVSPNMAAHLQDLNERVFDLLHLRPSERRIVTDFVNERMDLLHGKVTAKSLRLVTDGELLSYLAIVQRELNSFIGAGGNTHVVTAFRSDPVCVVHIELAKKKHAPQPCISSVTTELAAGLKKVRETFRREHSQWLYFNRNLRIYDGPHTYLFKPGHRLHWTETQGMLDADDIIAETLAGS